MQTATLPPTRSSIPALAGLILGLWGLTIVLIVQAGLLRQTEGSLPLRVAVSVIVPPLLYLLAYRSFPRLRAWVAQLDLAWLVGLQTFRVIGIVFLFVWGLGQLPAVFAFTAGLGDIVVGVTALAVLLAVERQTLGWQARVKTLTIFGILDFAAAFTTAALTGAGRPLQFAGQPLPAIMQDWPMAMIPGFLVPTFIILHLMTWQRLQSAD
jgi:hypothetical protein